MAQGQLVFEVRGVGRGLLGHGENLGFSRNSWRGCQHSLPYPIFTLHSTMPGSHPSESPFSRSPTSSVAKFSAHFFHVTTIYGILFQALGMQTPGTCRPC